LIDWSKVNRILVIRLRSIGDTVLSTPSLIALRRFLPDAQIDILLEDWVAPLLENFDLVDNVIAIGKGEVDRLKAAWRIRRNKYDVVFNLHGGTTSTLLSRATGAAHRIGYENYQYSSLYTHRLSSSSDFWQREKTHSAEQQLALLGFVGIPVDDRPRTRLTVSPEARTSISARYDTSKRYALLHPASLFATKQWSAENFAWIADHLSDGNIATVAVASGKERIVLDELQRRSQSDIPVFDDLSIPEITALAADAELFVGNDSGIAHIAAAVNTPTVVIFGSSNRDHWRPWTDAPNEIVFNEFDCQPCPGYECKVYGDPKCILSVSTEQVTAAIDRILRPRS
jgi:lipopolysaccharide heptosyltransferase II